MHHVCLTVFAAKEIRHLSEREVNKKKTGTIIPEGEMNLV